MDFDAAIIGAGVIGAMVARELSRYKLSVCLLEKENDVAMGASRANSGIIHGGYDPEPGTLKAKMNTKGIDLLYEAARQLNVHYENNGSLVCAFGTDQEEKALEDLYERSFQNGITCTRLISGEEARALEPNLSQQVSRALYVPNSGIICPYELTVAAVGNAMDNGVTLLRNFEVTQIETAPPAPEGLSPLINEGGKDSLFEVRAADGRSVICRRLFNCAGGFGDKIAQMAGDGFFRIIPRAGEYLLLDKAEGSRVRHTVFQVPSREGKGILVTPTVDGNLLTGPTARRTDTPESTQTTGDGLAQVARLAAKSVPSVNFRQVITSFSGVRSSTEGGDFLICRSQRVPGLIHLGAIDSPGLTACVAIAKEGVSLLGLPLMEKEDWNGVRKNTRAFREMNPEEKNAYIQKHPAYGKIVCRCEGVSEGEMVDAIRRNPPARDIDGIKRRTRGGMGRCQGGFCSVYVMQLLAREQNVPLEEITKSGKGSHPLVGKL